MSEEGKIHVDDEMHKLVEERAKHETRHWTQEDFDEFNAAMKNIADRPIWNAIYQARKWALIQARASVVKLETEEERKEWFDRMIESENRFIESTNRKDED
jgi:hypothetical protein